jgi:RNA polymerase sigma factor (sigma-70 family)
VNGEVGGDLAGPGTRDDEPATDIASIVGGLYAAYYMRLLGFAMILTKDRDVAHDAVQDAFMVLYRNWPKLRDQKYARGYLYTVVSNAVRVALRRVLHEPASHPNEELDDVRLAVSSAEDEVVAKSEASMVIDAMRRLPRREREAVLLAVDGFTPTESARLLGIEANAARVYLHHARNALREKLTECENPSAEMIDMIMRYAERQPATAEEDLPSTAAELIILVLPVDD